MTDREQIRAAIDEWAAATRDGRKDDVLRHHAADARIFDVLPPLQYEDAAAYRARFDEWWPETTDGGGKLDVADLTIVAGEDVAFAHGLVRCGGTAPDGSTFSDTVRLTHGLRKLGGRWQIVHSHTSLPVGGA